AAAAADVAGHVHARQEVHADGAHAVALAGLAAAALHVEGEPARLVAARTRLRHQAEQLAHEAERAGVAGRVAARRAADRALVDRDHLVDAVGAREAAVAGPLGHRTVAAAGRAP